VFSNENVVAMVAWTLGMQECGLSMTLSQQKMKVTKILQTSSPFSKMEFLGIIGGIGSNNNNKN
jgi:hypothetical protein